MKRQQQDYFGTYLKTVKGAETSSSSTAAEPQAEASPVDLLRFLQDSGPIDLSTLQRSTGLPFPRFSEMLNRLQEAGLIEVVGDPGAELAAITSPGRSLAQLE